MRRILHIDMDAFYAAVEERRRSHLVGKPVVVGGRGDPSKRGVVATANYEARKYGIHSAMPLQTAHRLCPDAVFLPVDFAEYSRISAIIKSILRTYSPVMQDVGIDEAYLDISRNPLPSNEIARRIKSDIRKATSLTCSIGIGPNKLVAKIASDLNKPDGLTIVLQQEVERLLGPLPVRKLHGVGPKTEARLGDLGIQTVAQLRELALSELVDRFGASYGNYLFQASRGIDDRPLVTSWKRKSIGRERTFQKDLRDWQEIARNLAGLTKKVFHDMNSRGLKGRTVTLKIRFSDFTTITRSRTRVEPLESLERIRAAAFENLGRVDLAGKRVRLIGVRIEGLE